jgi:hypothetical protein
MSMELSFYYERFCSGSWPAMLASWAEAEDG